MTNLHRFLTPRKCNHALSKYNEDCKALQRGMNREHSARRRFTLRGLLALLVVTIALGIAQVANAGPYEDARDASAAFNRKDYATALSLWKPLAARGNSQAQTSLGVMYSNGIGVPQDYKEAVRLYGLAAARGNTTAQFNLGRMYRYGLGVPQDYKEAVRLYRLAATQGHAGAQNNFGTMYEFGQGVPQKYVRAHMWYNLSASSSSSSDSKKAMENRNKIAAKMTPAQLEQVQEMARQCLATKYKQCGNEVNSTAPPAVPTNASPLAVRTNASSSVSVSMKKQGDIYVVPVLVNSTLTRSFMVDSGASDVSIPEDVVRTLVRTGTIKDTDFIGEQTYILADGSKVKSKTFRIRSLKVGDKVIENVQGSVASVNGSLLLRGGSVCLNSFPGFLSGASAGVRPPREATAG